MQPALLDAFNQACDGLDRDPRRALAGMRDLLPQMDESATAWFNFGLAQHLCGRPAAAIRAYELSLRCNDPPRRQLATNLAFDLLLSGRFEQGWRVYQHRRLQPLPVACHQWYGPCWNGASPLPPRLLLPSEQGFGDTLMALRFALVLQERGCQVQLACQQALVELIAHACPQLPVQAGLVRSPEPQAWAPLLDLPGVLGAGAGWMPHRQGYLSLQPDLVERWRQRLQRRPGRLLVALYWQGKPDSEQSLYTRGRSFPLQTLAPLAALPGLEVVCLQKGLGSEQWPGPFAGLQVAGQPAVSASASFLDTAAILANCDLLVSSDSAVVHLAGALGLPAWLLLKALPEWRWGLDGEACLWYESVRLFRQERAGCWDQPVQRLTAALVERCGSAQGQMPPA